MSLFALVFCVAVAAPVEDDHSGDAVFVGAVSAVAAVGGGILGAVALRDPREAGGAVTGVYLGAGLAGGLAAGLATLAVRPAPDALLVGGVSTASIFATNVLALLSLPFVFTGGIAIEVVLLMAHGPALEVGPLFEVLGLATYIVGASASVAIGAVGGLRAVDEWARSSNSHDDHRHRAARDGRDDADGEDRSDDGRADEEEDRDTQR